MSYSNLTVAQLKDLLRERGLKVSGRKAELVDRLEDVVDYDKNASLKNQNEKPSQTSENKYSNLTVVQLKDLLRERSLKVSGRKAELVARLQASKTGHMFRPNDQRIKQAPVSTEVGNMVKTKDSTSPFDVKPQFKVNVVDHFKPIMARDVKVGDTVYTQYTQSIRGNSNIETNYTSYVISKIAKTRGGGIMLVTDSGQYLPPGTTLYTLVDKFEIPKVSTTKVVCVKVKNIRPQYDNLKEWMDNPNNVYIGRAGIVFVTIDGNKQRWPKQSSKWANPFKIDKYNTREMVTQKYREHIIDKIKQDPVTYNLEELRGKTLGCWCKPEPCHGDVLLDLVENGLPK